MREKLLRTHFSNATKMLIPLVKFYELLLLFFLPRIL